jgi:hypothetical protein
MEVLAAKSLKKRCNSSSKRAVRCVDTGVIYASCSDAADILSLDGILINPRNILHVCQGIQKKTAGLRWVYVEDDLMVGDK